VVCIHSHTIVTRVMWSPHTKEILFFFISHTLSYEGGTLCVWRKFCQWNIILS